MDVRDTAVADEIESSAFVRPAAPHPPHLTSKDIQ